MCYSKTGVLSYREYPLIGEKINSYGNNDFAGYLWAILRMIQYTIIPLICLVFAKYNLKIVPKFEFAYLFLILLGIGVVFNPVIFSRFANYFMPLYSLSLATLICSFIRKKVCRIGWRDF